MLNCLTLIPGFKILRSGDRGGETPWCPGSEVRVVWTMTWCFREKLSTNDAEVLDPKKKGLKCLGKKQSRTSLKEYIQYSCIIRHLKIISNNENTSVLVLLQLKLTSSARQGSVFQLKFSSSVAFSKITKILITFKPKILGTVHSSDFFRSS